MRLPLAALLVFSLLSAGCREAPAPLQLTPEGQKVVDLAAAYLKNRGGDPWAAPIEVKMPPNRVNVPDWKKYLDEEHNIWMIVYPTPNDEMRALGPRKLFVNIRTSEVVSSARK
jgi:hypothetical protein